MKIFLLTLLLASFVRADYSPSINITRVDYINNNIGLTSGTDLGIFQASSAANVVTRMSGWVALSNGGHLLGIGPTDFAGGNLTPGGVNGDTWVAVTGAFSRKASVTITVTAPGTGTCVEPEAGVTVCLSGTSIMATFKDYIVPPGYYVAISTASVVTTNGGYQLIVTETKGK